MAEPYGAFALVLHSHLPYVLSHNRLEEEWLLEAVVESYLPLLQVLERLVLQGISPKVTIGLTPVLLEQLTDSRFAPLSGAEVPGGAGRSSRFSREARAILGAARWVVGRSVPAHHGVLHQRP